MRSSGAWRIHEALAGLAAKPNMVGDVEDPLLMVGKLKSWVMGKLVGGQVMKFLRLDFIKGHRTKVIAGGTILANLGAVVTHLASVMGGEAFNWGLIQANVAQIIVAFGLITAADHQPN